MGIGEGGCGGAATRVKLGTGGGERLDLSTRESAIINLIARGLTNRQIAQELTVSPETIKTCVSRVLRKLGVKNRAQAVARVAKHGLLDCKSETNPGFSLISDSALTNLTYEILSEIQHQQYSLALEVPGDE